MGAFLLTTGDFDGDGDVDIASLSDDHLSITVLWNSGDGSFQPPVTFPTGNDYSVALVAQDFEGDGDLDLAVGGSNLSMLWNDGKGRFADPVRIGPNGYPIGADFDKDGYLDLALDQGSRGLTTSVSLLLNDGRGAFNTGQRAPDLESV